MESRGHGADDRRAEEASAEAVRERDRLRGALESIEDGFVTLDDDWRFVYVNARAERFLERPISQLIGNTPWELFPEAVGGPVHRALMEARERGTTHAFEVEGPAHSWISARAYPSPGGISVFFQDVTDRKRGELWAAAQRRLLELMARGQPLPVVLDALALAIEEQLPGALCSVLLLDRAAGTLHMVAAPSIPARYSEAVNGVRIGPRVGSCGTAAFRCEPVIVEDVTTDPLWEGWRQLAADNGLRASWAMPIVDGSSQVLGIFALYRTVPHVPGERERSLVGEATRLAGVAISRQHDEDALRERERELALLADNVPDIISRYDLDLRCTYVNAALTREVGSPRESMLGKKPEEFFLAPDEAAEFVSRLRHVIATGEALDVSREYETPHGRRWYNARIVPELDGARIAGVLVVSRDVTQEIAALHALRESERRFRLLVENIEEVFYVTDPGFGETTYVSPAFESIWGIPVEGLHRDPSLWRGAIVPEDRARVDRAVEQAHDGSFALEYRIRRPDGTERYIRDRAFGVRDADGRVVQSVGIAEDLTERRRMEEAVRASESEHRALVEAMDDVVVVLDADGRYVKVAPTAPALLYRAADELLGRTLHEIFPPDVADRFLETTRAVLRDRRHLNLEYDLRIGSETRWFLATVSPMDDLVLWIARDITQRKRAEQALREALERYRLAGRATQDVMWDLDAAAGTVEWSEALHLVLGYEERKTDAETWWAARVHPEDRARVLAGYRAARERGQQTWSDEYRFRRADGTWAVLLDRASFVRDSSGRVVRAIGAMSDLTDRKRLEDQLRQALKMEAVGRLAGGVAHDFNNLLTAIMSSSELALADLPPGHPVRADVEEVRRAADRAAALTRQLLAFSRKQVLQPTVLDPNAVVADMEKMLRRVIGAEIDLRTSLAPRPGHVRADRGQLEQVIMNLAVNARDAMPGGGSLTITTGVTELRHDERAPRGMRPGTYVTIEVSDTGLGMDEDEQARAFEPFFTTKGVGRGTGLGLATVYGIVKQSDGYVYLRSAPGQGATFSIYLPRVEAAPAALATLAPAGDAPQRHALPVGAETVLLVEDETAVRALARRALVRYGYNVVDAGNGREALELLDRLNGGVDLVVTDLSMPVMGGRELARRLRERTPDARVLYMSGFADAGAFGDADASEGAMLIEKPFALDVFVRRVREALDETRERGSEAREPVADERRG